MKGRHDLSPEPADGTDGFTLVEALASAVLMAILLGLLATLTGHWMANWKTGFNRVQNADLLGLGIDRIAADLGAAQYVSLGDPDALVFFDGTETSVTFIRSAIGPNAAAGLEIVRLSETEDARGPVLVREQAPFAPVTTAGMNSGTVTFAHPTVLIRPPYHVTFSFAGHDRVWQQNWQNPKTLPDAVRIRVANISIDEPLPVSTAAIIKVNAPASCVTSQGQGDCAPQ
ncbi:MAG TPA: hypothetical protein VME69_03365 [Methylocella sp.]|nr:hypothetical protein [Methylocella sp.]